MKKSFLALIKTLTLVFSVSSFGGPTPMEKIRIGDLEPDQAYSIRVITTTVYDKTEASQPKNVTTSKHL
jgi:hypothetical protein